MNAASRKQWFFDDKYDDNEADKQSFQCKEQSQRNAARFRTKLETVLNQNKRQTLIGIMIWHRLLAELKKMHEIGRINYQFI